MCKLNSYLLSIITASCLYAGVAQAGTEFGACAAYVSDLRPGKNPHKIWPLVVHWKYVSETASTHETLETNVKGYENTHFNINEPKHFQATGLRFIVNVIKMEGQIKNGPLWSMTRDKDNNTWKLIYGNSRSNPTDFQVLDASLKCISSRDPLLSLPEPIPPIAGNKYEVEKPDADAEEPQKEGGGCNGCNVS